MSRSKEGLDKQNAADAKAEKQLNQSKTSEFDRTVGGRGQTDYTSGRESFRDFPRRSTSPRHRGESYGRTGSYAEPGDRYQQENRANPNRLSETRGGHAEDTGDFYSRSIRERLRGSQSERNQWRDEEGRNQDRGSYDEQQGRNFDPYRRYEDSRRNYANQQAYWQANQPDYDQQTSRQRQGRRSATRDFGTPNYESQDERGRNYGSQGYYPQTYTPRYEQEEADYRNEREDYRGRQEAPHEGETQRYNRGNQPESGSIFSNLPFGSGTPFFDPTSNFWPGAYYREHELYRYALRCRDIMTKDVTTCSPESSIREVAEKMEDDNVGSIPVVENGRLVGLVTDRDIVCRVLAEDKNTRSTTAREAMTEDIISCTPDEAVLEAIRKMGENQIRRLPICDSNGRLRGIISIGDIALEAERDRELACALEAISEPSHKQSRRR